MLVALMNLLSSRKKGNCDTGLDQILQEAPHLEMERKLLRGWLMSLGGASSVPVQHLLDPQALTSGIGGANMLDVYIVTFVSFLLLMD